MIEVPATRVNPDAGDEAPAEGTRYQPRITGLLWEAVKALTLRSEAPAPTPKKSTRKEEETGRGGFRLAAARVTINFRRMARAAFTAAVAIMRHKPFVRQAPAQTTEQAFWFQHWQNSAAPVADVSPGTDAGNHLSLDLSPC